LCSILVVDDERDVRETLARRLERAGHSVATAASQEEGAGMIRDASEPYDVVLTDMLMEEADSGLGIIREAMARDVFTEVIVLTAYGNVANAVTSMQSGAFDYVEKNVPGVDVFEVVVDKIAQALGRRRQSVMTLLRLNEYQKASRD